MAIFMNGEHNCACGRRVCDWSCTTYAKLMSDNIPNTVVGYVPPIKKTNAERIRNMNDEELAEWAMRGLFFPRCPVVRCPTVEDCKDCKDCWLLWLKEEVKE